MPEHFRCDTVALTTRLCAAAPRIVRASFSTSFAFVLFVFMRAKSAVPSQKVMKERLRNAIYNCQAIDGDDNFAGMQAAAMGWDWQEDEEDEM